MSLAFSRRALRLVAFVVVAAMLLAVPSSSSSSSSSSVETSSSTGGDHPPSIMLHGVVYYRHDLASSASSSTKRQDDDDEHDERGAASSPVVMLADRVQDRHPHEHNDRAQPGSSEFSLYLVIVIMLIVCAGVMSGLTVGLLSIDPLKLRMHIETQEASFDPSSLSSLESLVESDNRHWMLVTLLLANSLAMESLPIFLANLVPNAAAIGISVVGTFICCEVIPQALFTANAIGICSKLAGFVWGCMYVLSPVAYPLGKFLDVVVGHDNGQFLYRPKELKVLFDLYTTDAEQRHIFNPDIVDMLQSVLKFRTQLVRTVPHTPAAKMMLLKYEDVVDAALVRSVVRSGHSRFPVYSGAVYNIVGIVLAKSFLEIDCRAGQRVSDMPLVSPLFVTGTMRAVDLLNEFQLGTSHMAIITQQHVKAKRIFDAFASKHHYALHGRQAADDDSAHDDQQTKKSKTTTTEPETDVAAAVNVTVLGNDADADVDADADDEDVSYDDYDCTLDPAPVRLLGLITMEEILEALIGEQMNDEFDAQQWLRCHDTATSAQQQQQQQQTMPNATVTTPLLSSSATPSPTLQFRPLGQRMSSSSSSSSSYGSTSDRDEINAAVATAAVAAVGHGSGVRSLSVAPGTASRWKALTQQRQQREQQQQQQQ